MMMKNCMGKCCQDDLESIYCTNPDCALYYISSATLNISYV